LIVGDVGRGLGTTFFGGPEKMTAARTEDRLLVDDPLLAMGALHASIVEKNPGASRMFPEMPGQSPGVVQPRPLTL
jgi:hypothetical protein